MYTITILNRDKEIKKKITIIYTVINIFANDIAVRFVKTNNLLRKRLR